MPADLSLFQALLWLTMQIEPKRLISILKSTNGLDRLALLPTPRLPQVLAWSYRFLYSVSDTHQSIQSQYNTYARPDLLWCFGCGPCVWETLHRIRSTWKGH
jgi:hypothetical protein